MKHKNTSTVGNQRGVSAVLVAVVLVAMVAMVAFAIDIGYVAVTKNELQNVADAGALAAARQLGYFYETMLPVDQDGYDVENDDSDGDGKNDLPSIIEAAKSVVGPGKNTAGGQNIIIRDGDIFINDWAGSVFNTNDYVHPTAVRVIARRDSAANSPISTFFARVMGIDTVNVSADATAALTGQSTADDDVIPVGISEVWFERGTYCGDEIVFSPTNVSCAGWNTLTDSPAADSKIRNNILTPLYEGTYDYPDDLGVGSSANFIGGDLSTGTFDAFEALFEKLGYDVWIDAEGNKHPFYDTEGEIIYGTILCDPDAASPGQYCDGASPDIIPLMDEDGVTQMTYTVSGNPMNEHVWPTKVIVFESPGDTYDPITDTYSCGNPNKAMKILGFASVEITRVLNAPDKTIKGVVKCGQIDSGRGSGEDFGVLGSIPGLVE